MGRLILWDIDGTLIRGGGVGSQALKRAACEVAALADIPRVDPHGKTDPQILREMFQAAQVDPERIDGFVADATIGMERALAELEHELRAKASILPGVVEVLKRIDALADVRQTLLTGNIAANAAIKVAAFGLTEFFDAEVGAYGTDHEDRLELVPIALDRVVGIPDRLMDGRPIPLPDHVNVQHRRHTSLEPVRQKAPSARSRRTRSPAMATWAR